MPADKGKKLKVSDDENSVDCELVVSIEKLQEVQDQLEKINEEVSDEVLVVEQKYNEIRQPVYKRRNEIIKSIPDFWLTAFLCHPALSELLNEEDHKIFKYLDSLEIEEAKDVKSGYSIHFIFNSNPYFEDAKLTKTFTFQDKGAAEVSCTPIKWKEGRRISNGTLERKGNKRPSHDESFFSWFSETPAMGISDIYDEIAEIIKEDLWPNPLIHFNNEDEDELDIEDEDDDEGEGVDGFEFEDDEESEKEDAN